MKKILILLTCTLSFWDDSLQTLSLRYPYLEELTGYAEIKTFSDDSNMTDVGGVIYKIEKEKLYERIFQDSIKVKRFGAKGVGNPDDLDTEDNHNKKTLMILSDIYKYYTLIERHLFRRFTFYFRKGIYIINMSLQILYFGTIV